MEHAYILSDDTIEPGDLPELSSESEEPPVNGQFVKIRIGETIEAAERKLIMATLESLDGDKKRSADVLGISLKTLYNRLQRYDDLES